MLIAARDQHHHRVGAGGGGGVATIQIDCSGLVDRTMRDGRHHHLFSGLPIQMAEAGAATSERERLIADDDDDKQSRKPRVASCEERLQRIAWAVSAVVCTLALIAAVVAAAILFRRVNDTISSVDGAVSFHRSATNMIRNVDTLLNTSAQIAGTVHKLGLKGLDASMFSSPYLTQMLNTTTNLLHDVHRVAEHPSIQIGG
jgi:hypothetical protein